MKKFKILIPVFNDWQSLSKLLNNIDNDIKNMADLSSKMPQFAHADVSVPSWMPLPKR